MVWGGISYDGCTDLYVIRNGSLTGVRYRDEILAPIVRPFAGAIGDDFILMDDNARPHRSRLVNQYLEQEQSKEWIGLRSLLILIQSSMLGTFFKEEFLIVKTHQTLCRSLQTHLFRNGQRFHKRTFAVLLAAFQIVVGK